MWLYGDSLAIPNECLQSVEYVPFDFEDDLVGKIILYGGSKYMIIYQSEYSVFVYQKSLNYRELLEKGKFLDGSPCGKLKQ